MLPYDISNIQLNTVDKYTADWKTKTKAKNNST